MDAGATSASTAASAVAIDSNRAVRRRRKVSAAICCLSGWSDSGFPSWPDAQTFVENRRAGEASQSSTATPPDLRRSRGRRILPDGRLVAQPTAFRLGGESVLGAGFSASSDGASSLTFAVVRSSHRQSARLRLSLAVTVSAASSAFSAPVSVSASAALLSACSSSRLRWSSVASSSACLVTLAMRRHLLLRFFLSFFRGRGGGGGSSAMNAR